MTQTDNLLDKIQREQTVEPGDHDKMSHYAPKQKILEAMVEGVPITALCGKTWVPTRDGSKFPTCPQCEEAFERLEDG